MGNISVNIPVLLLVGIPQSFLSMLAIHIFTQTKIVVKKYIMLSLIFVAITYLIRFLPIAIGVNTVLTLLATILLFQFAYKTELSKIIRTIISTVVAFMLIAFSEVFNMMLLTLLFSQPRATELLNSSDEFTQGISSAPSNIFFVILIFLGYLILKTIRKRANKDGATSEKTGE
ncbi:MAG: hypothetical protein VB111_12560 [Clostridiaceae bacterium]|nr:hypothetical protein [Clostridiaceae bacterium]